MKITIEIETGNDAMQTPSDVGHALGILVQKFYQERKLIFLDQESIRDINGNTVGKVSVTE